MLRPIQYSVVLTAAHCWLASCTFMRPKLLHHSTDAVLFPWHALYPRGCFNARSDTSVFAGIHSERRVYRQTDGRHLNTTAVMRLPAVDY